MKKEIAKADKRIKFMEFYLLPESETQGNIKQSAIKAGYAESTADKQGKRILENSIEAYNKVLDNDEKDVGNSRENELKEYFDFDKVASKLQDLAYQDENKRVAADLLLKVMDKLHKVPLNEESETQATPELKIVVSEEKTVRDVDVVEQDD